PSRDLRSAVRGARSRAPPPRPRSGCASRRSPCWGERNLPRVDWRERYERAAARYESGETREADERQLVQLANAAWAARLSLLVAGDRWGAWRWLRQAAARYRESWDAGGATDAWGRPIGALKALLIADEAGREHGLPDDSLVLAARWTLDIGAAEAES